MAKVTLENSMIKDCLADLSKKTTGALAWLPDAGETMLDISEPYALDGMGPDAQHPCFGPPLHDDRGEVRILLAVFDAMRKKEKKGSPTTQKTSRRK